MSTSFGVLVFLTVLLFTVHFMLLLYVQSVAADAALVGAHKLAGRGDLDARGPVAEADAQAQARRMLGRAYEHSWVGPADRLGYVTFTVRTQPYRLAGGDPLGRPVVRSATVKIEDLR